MKAVLVAVLFMCRAVYAQQSFSVEEPLNHQAAIPAHVLSDLSGEVSLERSGCAQSNLAEAFEAAKVELGSKYQTILLKPRRDAWCLCGAYYCPVWVYQLTSKGAKRIWSTPGTAGVEILNKRSRGYREIRTEGGTAGHGFAEIWAWDGKMYKLVSRKGWIADQ